MLKTSLVVLATCALVSLAEPPRWRSAARFTRFQRIEAAPAPASPTQAPVPHTVYGPPAPAPSYGPPPPSPSYGPPSNDEPTTTEAPTTTESPTTSSPAATNTTSSRLRQKPETGVYYIYHPSGVLQKVRYETNDDVRNMAFSAKLKYENVEPITGPIYTYDPQTYVFQKLQK
ncbi:uncharacterized protein LOC143191994 [Rhynchophorus ferrugineus]|uniref:Uncharacterized protein n=1 Tax=Rhynchophorus ferrugineus TaxID=354439 RepID=A0A834MH89_RHYFE|nr:hypothetical protein GWI33_006526 [Rhynchophorus ferrugineus]